MLNLVLSDLYRITRPRGLRGAFWQYGAVIVAVYAIVALLAVLANSPQFQELTGGGVGSITTVASPTEYLAGMMGSIVPLCVSYMVIEHALAELKGGYVKSVLSARAGRLSYFAGKVLFAGALSALVTLFAAAVACALIPVQGIVFGAADTPLAVGGWLAGFWLNTWALAVLSLALAYATRVSPISYIGGFCFTMSVVPQLLMGLAYSSGGVLRFLAPLAPAFETLAAWMPSSSLSSLSVGGQVFLSTSADVWGQASRALTVDPGVQVILTGVIWIVVASVLVLAIARTRDI